MYHKRSRSLLESLIREIGASIIPQRKNCISWVGQGSFERTNTELVDCSLQGPRQLGRIVQPQIKLTKDKQDVFKPFVCLSPKFRLYGRG